MNDSEREERNLWRGLTVVFAVAFIIATVLHATDACAATRDLQTVLNRAGRGATVHLSGSYYVGETIYARRGQTIVGGELVHSGSGYAVGLDLRAGGVTVRGIEVHGFDHGIVCGPRSTIRRSYVHDNSMNGIGCHADGAAWHIRIIGNTITHNGSAAEEHHSASGIKLLSIAKPRACLGCGAIVRNNIANDNTGNGIWFDQSSNGIIASDNTAVRNTHHGIRCEKCGGPVLFEDNTTHDNVFNDVSVVNSAVVRIVNATGVKETKWTPGIATKTWPTYGDPTTGYRNIRRVRFI